MPHPGATGESLGRFARLAPVTNNNLRFDTGSYIGRTYPYSHDRPPQVIPVAATDSHDGHEFTNLWEVPTDGITITPARPA
ncbi:hypothetical protein [Nocardia sp. SC052]|uniref:hypothetical protein n=1 Tax=Nocardia sichangensis TaxID=3385975 RepID=UPI0039A1AB10